MENTIEQNSKMTAEESLSLITETLNNSRKVAHILFFIDLRTLQIYRQRGLELALVRIARHRNPFRAVLA